MKVILPSPAKINLSLWVKEKRDDGYHEILTVFHTVNLFDYITIQRSGHLELNVIGSTIVPSGGSNLVIKACKVFSEKLKMKVKVSITLEKNIPVGAGLGGGSSNAAAVLKGLNTLYDNPFTEEELLDMASLIGSDVAFFIKGGLAIGTGRGEELVFYGKQNFDLVLLYPNIFCSTKEVYENLPSIKSDIEVEDAERLILIPLLKGDLATLKRNMHNDLEQSKAKCVKDVLNVKNEFEKYIGSTSLMSGSGSSIFTVMEKNEKIDISPLQRNGYWVKFLSAI